MGKIGIGKRIHGKRGRFTLREVKLGEKTIYSNRDQKLNASDMADPLRLSQCQGPSNTGFGLKVVFETPLRIKFENRLKANLPFHVLVRAMLRRISLLLSCYGGGEPDLDYKGLVKRAGSVSIVDTDLKWFDWKRYSHRQDKSMLMGGMIGSITYEGKIDEFLPIIDFCSKVHIGKQPAFGLGKISSEQLS